MTENLLDMETMIFDVIKEYSNRNRPFQIEELIPYIQDKFSKASININNKGIREILVSLVEKKLVVEGSVLLKTDVLKNLQRRQIYHFIEENPGAIFNKILKSLKLSNYVVFWHVKILIKFEFIKTARIDNHDAFFNVTITPENFRFYYLKEKEISKQIINFLTENDIGVSKTKISLDLKMHINTVNKYLELLEEIKVITKETINNKDLYFLNE